MSDPKFVPGQFTSYTKVYSGKRGLPPHGSAEHKAWFANAFVKLVRSDFKETAFSERFYDTLRSTFGHIAHYNRGGFYDTWFSTLPQRLEFLELSSGNGGLYGSSRAATRVSFVGDPRYSFVDVEKAIAEWITESGLIAEYGRRLAEATEASERAVYAKLKEKYG